MKIENFEKAQEIEKKLKKFKDKLESIKKRKKYDLRIIFCNKEHSFFFLSLPDKEIFDEKITAFLTNFNYGYILSYFNKRIKDLERELDNLKIA